jgi:hypothetical protein
MDTDKLLETFVPLATMYALRVVAVLAASWVAFGVAGWLQHRVTAVLRRRQFDDEGAATARP